MLSDYAPLLLLLALAAAFVVGNLVISEVLGRPKPGVGKKTVYECGMPIRGTARARFSVHYYLLALLFILFDVEAAFLLPWAAHAEELGKAGLVAMGGFAVVLVVGLLYVMRKKALEWDR
ncbi:MAG: NADH-quinone oxidoreductase subunit A [Planctomycetes bacterium]|nr:NADH-quinone oxidoreductase subunit A [Planctomycetota bacterium]